MTAYPMRSATAGDQLKVIQTITLGFSADPVARWIWPDAETYLAAMPRFAFAFGGKAFVCDTADVAEDFRAAALWLPPGYEPASGQIDAVFATTVRPEIADDLEGVFEQMDRHHPIDPPCWYLPMIAADPAHLGKGWGGAVLRHGLRRCDEEGVLAYLESSNPRNIDLYRRHGFECSGEIQVGSSPSMFPMIRKPRP